MHALHALQILYTQSGRHSVNTLFFSSPDLFSDLYRGLCDITIYAHLDNIAVCTVVSSPDNLRPAAFPPSSTLDTCRLSLPSRPHDGADPGDCFVCEKPNGSKLTLLTLRLISRRAAGVQHCCFWAFARLGPSQPQHGDQVSWTICLPVFSLARVGNLHNPPSAAAGVGSIMNVTD